MCALSEDGGFPRSLISLSRHLKKNNPPTNPDSHRFFGAQSAHCCGIVVWRSWCYLLFGGERSLPLRRGEAAQQSWEWMGTCCIAEVFFSFQAPVVTGTGHRLITRTVDPVDREHCVLRESCSLLPLLILADSLYLHRCPGGCKCSKGRLNCLFRTCLCCATYSITFPKFSVVWNGRRVSRIYTFSAMIIEFEKTRLMSSRLAVTREPKCWKWAIVPTIVAGREYSRDINQRMKFSLQNELENISIISIIFRVGYFIEHN